MTDERIRAEELDRLAQRAVAAYREIADTDGTPLATIIDAVEKAVIEAALREHRTIVHTAAAIGMSRNGLRTKMIVHRIKLMTEPRP